MSREILKFESEKEFNGWAIGNASPYGSDAIQNAKDIISHEKAHFQEAKSLGYNPFYAVYACFYGKDKKKEPEKAIVQWFFIDYGGKKPNKQDLIKICNAPENPSVEDLDIITLGNKKIS